MKSYIKESMRVYLIESAKIYLIKIINFSLKIECNFVRKKYLNFTKPIKIQQLFSYKYHLMAQNILNSDFGNRKWKLGMPTPFS